MTVSDHIKSWLITGASSRGNTGEASVIRRDWA